MFGVELAFKEPSKALYALANASCFQSGTSRSFPFSRRSSTREKTVKGWCDETQRRREKHFPSPHLLFCSICCFFAAFSHSTSFPFLGAFNAHEFVSAREKNRCNILFSVVLCLLSVFLSRCCIRRESICTPRENHGKFLCRYLVLSPARVYSQIRSDWMRSISRNNN